MSSTDSCPPPHEVFGQLSSHSFERDILALQGVQITTKRAVIEGTTYAVPNITSVSVLNLGSERSACIWVALIGLVGASCSLAVDATIVSMVCGVVTMAGVLYAIAAKANYAVKIGTSGAETHALVTTDRDQAGKVAAALNEAMIHRA